MQSPRFRIEMYSEMSFVDMVFVWVGVGGGRGVCLFVCTLFDEPYLCLICALFGVLRGVCVWRFRALYVLYVVINL